MKNTLKYILLIIFAFTASIIIYEYVEANTEVNIEEDEVFVSDGAKCDCGNIVDIFAVNNKVAITDPVYPVYLDTNVMSRKKWKL